MARSMDNAAGVGDDESGEDEQFFADLLGKQNLREGAKVAHRAAKDRKGKQKEVVGGGSFQSLGLPPSLLKSLLQRGFTTPTPIQRAALPAALSQPPRDVVGMARTGSGKTLAYMIPLIARLGVAHSPKYGARALVLVPTRELALQVLKVGKDLARGAKGKHGPSSDPTSSSENEALRWGLLVGGDSLDEQFAMMAANPDVLIATPGRLLHLLVEMSADLASVQYVVFDEADRLFELGFSTTLTEILAKLSPQRQTLLFSATLPKSLVEFAKAGLQNPKLVRLDAESKISTDLQMAFFSVKPKEKEAALLILLRNLIGVPQADPNQQDSADWLQDEDERRKPQPNKRKRENGKATKKGDSDENKQTSAHQTIVFAATKHHVEYLSLMLTMAGYAVSAIYGSLDQSARRIQLAAFRSGRTSIMVVTDLAARGIDIPVLENVINYDFPNGSRTFIHRVGRTARAGRTGWAYSFVTNSELAQLFDLQLFLGRPLLTSPLNSEKGEPDYANNLVLGTLPRETLDMEVDHFQSALLLPDSTLERLLGIAEKGQRMYERSQSKASQESYRRAKELVGSGIAGLAGSEKEESGTHPLFGNSVASAGQPSGSEDLKRATLLAKVNAFRPMETVFEVGSRGKTVGAQLMQQRRASLGKARAKITQATTSPDENDETAIFASDDEAAVDGALDDASEADEDEIMATFKDSKIGKKFNGKKDFRDTDVYMGYVQAGADAERGYSLKEGGDSFAAQAASAAFEMTATDENSNHSAVQKASMLRWDRRHKKFVQGDGTGSDNKKLIRTESGGKLPASFNSGSFTEWKRKQKVYLPKTGEAELRDRQVPSAGLAGKRYRHTASSGRPAQGKTLKLGKGGIMKDSKKAKAAGKDSTETKTRSSGSKGLMGGKRASAQLKSVDQIRKERATKAKRVHRSNQPGKSRKR